MEVYQKKIRNFNKGYEIKKHKNDIEIILQIFGLYSCYNLVGKTNDTGLYLTHIYEVMNPLRTDVR